ncbi:MAG: MtnX-like HAD-IB family phosphatase [Calditrichaeota bacterium]|nr:MtnX-like HAD-IB family phosphatase [Calditrichota bacterium]
MNQTKFKIFCDFDGTVAVNDVGNELFGTFATKEWETAVEEWKEGKISSRECLERECAVTTLSQQDLNAFCERNPIDPTFREFAEYCRTQEYPIEILSDGMDRYIQEILRREALDWIPVRSNKMVFIDSVHIRPEFPYWEHTCGVCANCKGYHLRNARDGKSLLVYVGDGLSDRCGVKEADIIFAKDELIDYCQQNHYDYIRYRNFRDVQHALHALKKENHRVTVPLQ